MLTLPAAYSSTIIVFRTLFSKRVWRHAELLLLGAILAPAQRTVCSALRVLGLGSYRHYGNFHRVLNRDQWSLREGSRLLLLRVVERFVPEGPVLIGLDDTLERRWGPKIRARGIYRDAVRSSKSHFVKASGLRWLSAMVITPIPFAIRSWALPIMTALSPSERYNQQQGRRHKRLPEIARGMLLLISRWLPGREVICVADSSFAVLDLLAAVAPSVTMITRLRLDAALYKPAPRRSRSTIGRPSLKGDRLPKLNSLLEGSNRPWQKLVLSRWYQQTDRSVEVLSGTAVWYNSGKPVVPLRWVLVRDPEGEFKAQAFLSTDLDLSAQQILEYYIERWAVEVTFEESRAHLGVETQRQWSDLAIARTTPSLFALYSIVTLIGSDLDALGKLVIRTASWYKKEHATFSDVLAAVRAEAWENSLSMSPVKGDMAIIPRSLYRGMISTLCYGS